MRHEMKHSKRPFKALIQTQNLFYLFQTVGLQIIEKVPNEA